jgi:hypothetical protein
MTEPGETAPVEPKTEVRRQFVEANRFLPHTRQSRDDCCRAELPTIRETSVHQRVGEKPPKSADPTNPNSRKKPFREVGHYTARAPMVESLFNPET